MSAVRDIQIIRILAEMEVILESAQGRRQIVWDIFLFLWR